MKQFLGISCEITVFGRIVLQNGSAPFLYIFFLCVLGSQFGGYPKMVSKGPSSRGFDLRCVVPPALVLVSCARPPQPDPTVNLGAEQPGGSCRERKRPLNSGVVPRVFGEGVKSARGEIAIPGRSDHTRNMFGTSLHTTDCKQTIALKTAKKCNSSSTIASIGPRPILWRPQKSLRLKHDY